MKHENPLAGVSEDHIGGGIAISLTRAGDIGGPR